jgi:ABC-type branched-subunit amino acid transport system substrate-binding protein
VADAGTVRLAQLVPLSGGDARRGADWRNGVEMAVQAIRAAGGPVFEVHTYDAAAGGRPGVLRVLEGGVTAVLAVLPAGAMLPVLERGVPVILPGVAGTIVNAPPLPPVLASPSPGASMRRFLPWLRGGFGLRRFAVLGGEDTRPWRAAFRAAAGPAGLEVVADLAAPPRGTPGAEIAALLRAGPEAVFLDAPSAECARLLVALRAAAPGLPVAGPAVLTDPATLEAAGAAARQLISYVVSAAEAPAFMPFSARFAAAFKTRPGPLAIDGYVAAMMVRAGLAAMQRGEAANLAAALRDLRTGADETLLATRWSASGEPDRDTFIARIAAPDEIEWLTMGA